jgi:hypothetical protein
VLEDRYFIVSICEEMKETKEGVKNKLTISVSQ